ncbi:PUA-like domain-containing protein [Lasiosphaeris hirsuta]|uniref:Thymocyte nuclear protein 1 n=1 Tax=Lasiosphaeris hirsuta TaxID=260670 RepID=A0AA40AYU9_9PEZI|nr:PUA-like domain-containing protein [Lasiosphaeris hirsuta]
MPSPWTSPSKTCGKAAQICPEKRRKSSEASKPEPEPEPEPPAKRGRVSRQAPKAKVSAPPAEKSARKGRKPQANGAASLAREDSPVAPEEASATNEEKTYWLMKAEPNSRFENGVDVKFSIDDLASKKEPEPWDGIRSYAARNNLRAMKKGDLAFFYHSNCKEPGIAGIMEIVQEHSPDLSAHDPKAPYYDASSKPSDPKWSIVHVQFSRKFPVQIGLQELKALGARGEPLENMQMIKQSRLSVSKVSAAEWKFLMDVASKKSE